MNYEKAWNELKQDMKDQFEIVESDIAEFKENGNEDYLTKAKVLKQRLIRIYDIMTWLEVKHKTR